MLNQLVQDLALAVFSVFIIAAAATCIESKLCPKLIGPVIDKINAAIHLPSGSNGGGHGSGDD